MATIIPLTLQDFGPVITHNTSPEPIKEKISKCGKYKLQKDSKGYYYPCRLYYPSLPPNHPDQFYCYIGNVGTDYSFSFKGALNKLNIHLEHLRYLKEQTKS